MDFKPDLGVDEDDKNFFKNIKFLENEKNDK
jgi:hypothetical protein